MAPGGGGSGGFPVPVAVGETLGVGDGGEVGVDGGTGVAVGTTGVDSPGFGAVVPAGMSVAMGLESDTTVVVGPAGVKVSVATASPSRPRVRAMNEPQTPRLMNSNTARNAKAEPLPCIRNPCSSRLVPRSDLRDSVSHSMIRCRAYKGKQVDWLPSRTLGGIVYVLEGE